MDPESDIELMKKLEDCVGISDEFSNPNNLPNRAARQQHVELCDKRISDIKQKRKVTHPMADQVEEEDHLKEIRRFEKVEHANAFFGGQNDAGFLITQDPFHPSYTGTTEGVTRKSTFEELFAHNRSRSYNPKTTAAGKRVAPRVGQKRQDKSRPKQFNARMLK